MAMRWLIFALAVFCTACVLTPEQRERGALERCTWEEETGVWSLSGPPENAAVYRALAASASGNPYRPPTGHWEEFWLSADGGRMRLCVTDPWVRHFICDGGWWSFVATSEGLRYDEDTSGEVVCVV